MHSNIIEEKKKELKLTQLQRETIVGSMLGDGHLESQNKGRTYRLKIEYSAAQKEYLYWFFEIFKDWAGTPPRLKTKIRPSGFVMKTLYFQTYSHGALRFYDQQFYSREGKKVIPKMIGKLLTPLALAIWFMDDGSWKSKNHKTYIIHADDYGKQDLLRIQKCLYDKFGIETSLHKQYKNWRFYIKTSSAEKFKGLVQRYILPSMKYKLGNANSLKGNGGAY